MSAVVGSKPYVTGNSNAIVVKAPIPGKYAHKCANQGPDKAVHYIIQGERNRETKGKVLK